MNQNLKIGNLPISFIRNLVITSTFLFACCTAFSQTTQNTLKTVTTNIYSNVGGYAESLPNDYAANPSKKYPLIIFLHGSGELGDGSASSLAILNRVGITKLLANKVFPSSFSYGGANYSFIVVAPQMKSSNDWTNSIQAVIDYCKKTYRVDENRIYLTGLSLGGICAWDYSASSVARGQALAASLLVCPGAVATSAQLKNISQSQLPIWITNNSGDPINLVSGALTLLNAINATVPAPPKALITIFDRSGHDAWTQTYDPAFTQNGLNVYQWMLSHSRSVAQSPASPPVVTASAGANQVLTLPVNSATLDASGSKVSSGTIASYTWTKLSGPSSGTITLVSNGLQAKLTNLVAGVYTYQLTVKSSYGNTATANVTVTVNVSTDHPIPNAGKVGTVTLPENTFTLDGSLSKASAGNTIVSYKWSKLATSPAGGNITSPNSAITEVTGLQEGTYVFSLLVTDNRGSSWSAGTTVYVKPAAKTASTDPPTAVPSAPGYITLPVNTYTFDGSASKASSGNSIVSYLWTKTSGPAGGNITSPNSVKTTITNLQEGVYYFRLTVKDNNGRSAATGTYIYVYATPPVPTAVPGNPGNITLPVNTYTFDGSGSSAAPGTMIVSYLWTKKSGPAGGNISSPNSAKTTITNLQEGKYVFDLTVKANNGYSSTTETYIVVSSTSTVASTQPPTAVPSDPGYITLPVNTYTFDGSASKASSGNSIVSYLWTKTSGPAGGNITSPNSVKTTITNLQEGLYYFRLTVKDNNGRSAATGTYIYVYATPPVPTAVPSAPGYITLPVNTYTFDGSASTAAPGTMIVSYLWTKTSGPAGGNITSPNSAKTTITNLQEGLYYFHLTVKANNGYSTTTGTYIYVYAKPPVPTAVPGNPGNITLPVNTYTFDGSGSTAAPGTMIVSYLWTKKSGPAGGNISSPNSAKTTITNLQEGKYIFDLTVKTNNGYSSTTETYIVVNPSGTSKRTIAGTDATPVASTPDNVALSAQSQLEESGQLNITVSPNPVISDMNILIKGSAKGKTNIAIYDINGKMLQQQEFNKDGSGSVSKTVNISKLPSGIYLVQVMVEGKFRKVMKIVKQ